MTLVEYFPKLIDRTIPVSVLQIPPRVFLNWKNEGIIDLPINDSIGIDEKRKTNRKWAYLNMFDALWLLIVKELRAFNIDLKTIRQLKDFLFDIDNLIEELSIVNIDEFRLFFINQLPEELIENFNPEYITKEMILEYLKTIDDDYKSFYTQLGTIMSSVLIFKQSPSIQICRLPENNQLKFRVFMQEIVFDNFDSKVVFDDILFRFSNDFFINIPIKPLIEVMFEDEVFEKHNINYNFFNEKEKKVLELLRDDNYKEINIKKGTDGLIHLESKSQLEYKNEKAKEIRKLMGLKEYDRIELIQRNDKHIIINKTNREKL